MQARAWVLSTITWRFSKPNLRPAPFYTEFRTRPTMPRAWLCRVRIGVPGFVLAGVLRSPEPFGIIV